MPSLTCGDLFSVRKTVKALRPSVSGILGKNPTTSEVTESASDGKESIVLNLSRKSLMSLMYDGIDGMEGLRNLSTRTEMF